MPVVISGPYPSVQDVANLARVLVNDTYEGATGTPGEGRILTNDWFGMLPLINSAIRDLSRKLANHGQTTFIKDNVILTPILPVATPDPSVQTFLSYTGYFDGMNMWPSPVLPPDLLEPMELGERITGSNNPFAPMNQCTGLSSRFQYPYLCDWEWRSDQINFNGSQQTEDVRLRYEALILTPIQLGSDFTTTNIGTIDCQDALAYDIAWKFSQARGSADAVTLKANRDEAVEDMISRFIRRNQGVQYQRPAYNSGSGGNLYPGINQGNWQ